MKGVVGAGLAITAALPLGTVAVLAAAIGAGGTAGPSPQALAEIPPPLLETYVASAASCPGLAWTVLAAVAEVESDHGRLGGARLEPNGRVVPPIVGIALDGSAGVAAVADTDGGHLDGDITWDRAVGPMQFLPSTWRSWGRDANGDGVADPHNAIDASAAAAAYLCGPTGRVSDLAAAVATYNRSDAYVAEVLAVAASYGATAVPPGPSVAAVLASGSIALSGPALADLESGLVDPRLVSTLAIAAGQYPIGIGVIRTGHSQCVGGSSRAERPGCSVSNHWYYRGVDIPMVAGRPVAVSNAEARALAEMVLRLPASLRPDEVGLPWAAMDPLPGVFSDSAHQGHIHLGWRASNES